MLKINTLEGGVQTVDITPMTTIGELKCMLVDQRRCLGHKLVRAQILTDGMIADDDNTLEFLGVLNGHFNLTVVYSKAEVEAATAKEICENEDVQANIPAGVAIIKDLAFMSCNQVVIVNGSESVTEIRKAAFLSCKSLVHVDMSRSSLNFIDVRGRLGLVGASNFFGYQLWFWVTLWFKAFWFGVELIMVFEAEMIQFFRIHSSLSRSAGHERDR